MSEDYSPCSLVEHEDGTFSLLFTAFDLAATTFDELGEEGGGYGWHGVADALVRLKAPELAKNVSYDPEASMFVARARIVRY